MALGLRRFDDNSFEKLVSDCSNEMMCRLGSSEATRV